MDIIKVDAPRLMLVGGISAFVLTLHWVRKRDLREKYAVLWIGLALLLLLCGLFPQGVMSLAPMLGLSYTAVVLVIALAFIYVFSFGVSVSLTRQFRRNIRLMQEIALLEQRVRELESARDNVGRDS